MTATPSGFEASGWTSALVIIAITAVLGVNAMLLHSNNRKANGRLVRPLLRLATGKPRARSLSITEVYHQPMPMQQQHQHHQQHQAGAAKQNVDSRAISSDNEVWEVAARWVRWDPNAWTRAIVQGWIDSGDEDSAKRALMGKRLAFGTSGLRGAMGPGFCRINDLVIIQTTQGLCRYLEKAGGEEFKARGVVIGRDHRKQGGLSSEGFANLAAAVFISQGFRVFLMEGTVATPLVAYGVSHMKACAGVMVTASHNPKKDNGYKVYWGNGSQIIPPHDAGIASSIQNNLEPWQVYDPAAAIAGPLCSNPTETIADAYYQGIRESLCRRSDANARSELEVVYSAMHGVGDAWAQRAFRSFSLPPFVSVSCQSTPDPEFSTVQYPNPEEQGALKEAMILAEARGIPLVLANDPDGDRLAAAERQPTGNWHVFSGNEIGALLGVWQWEEWRRANPDKDPSDAVMIASTVSSKMLSAVAGLEGFTFEETLPGYKWMGHRGQQLKAQGKTFLFAYEEAIGFGPGDVVFEKDGLSSAALFAEMLVALRDEDEARQAEEAPSAATTVPAGSSSAGVARDVDGTPSCVPPLTILEEGSDPKGCPTLFAETTVDDQKVRAPSRWPNGIFKASVLSRHRSKRDKIGSGKESLTAPSSSIASPPPSSPSTVGVSPPQSPLTMEDHVRDFPPVSTIEPAPSTATGTLSAVAEHPPGEAEAEQGAERERRERCRFSSTLLRRVKALHERYGEFAEENGYVRCEDTEVLSKIFARLRGDGSYFSSFGDYKVTSVRDLAEGYGFDSETGDGKPTLPLVGGGAHFLTFKFGEEGVVATLRTSGTEPKIKFYLEMQGEPGVPLEEVSARLEKVAEIFIEEALQLKRWGMKRVALA